MMGRWVRFSRLTGRSRNDSINKRAAPTIRSGPFIYRQIILSSGINSIQYPVLFQPKNLGRNINSEYPEYLPCISASGTQLIFTRRLEGDDQTLQEDLFISFINSKDSVWSSVIPMSINTKFNEGSVTISADQKFLIYTACDREDGFGRCDLYICVQDENGFWSSPMNLGSMVNTRYWESQACFSPDGQYLYFVSDRKGGFGGNLK